MTREHKLQNGCNPARGERCFHSKQALSARCLVAIHQSQFLFFQTPPNQRRGRNFHNRRGQRYKENLHNYSSLAAPHQTSVVVTATTPPSPGPEPARPSPFLPSTISHPLFKLRAVPGEPQRQASSRSSSSPHGGRAAHVRQVNLLTHRPRLKRTRHECAGDRKSKESRKNKAADEHANKVRPTLTDPNSAVCICSKQTLAEVLSTSDKRKGSYEAEKTTARCLLH